MCKDEDYVHFIVLAHTSKKAIKKSKIKVDVQMGALKL